MGPTIRLRNFASRMESAFRPEPAFDKVFEDLRENIRELYAISFAGFNTHKPLSFVKRELRCGLIDLRPINVFKIRISVSSVATIKPKKFPLLQFNSELFFHFAHQRLLGGLPGFQMAAKEIPVIWERNGRVIVAKVDH
jgi:hypothetical protein